MSLHTESLKELLDLGILSNAMPSAKMANELVSKLVKENS